MSRFLPTLLRVAPLLMALAALPAAAQPADTVAWRSLTVRVGGGYGTTFGQNTSGPAWHGQAHVTFARTPGRGPLRGRAEVWMMGQRGTASGSPFACTRVRQLYCFGRTDRNTLAGTGLSLAVEHSFRGGRVRTFGRTGGGVYHSRVHSTEVEGPTTLCVQDNAVVSCADNPPFRDDVVSGSRTALGMNVGVGVEARIAGIAAFVELGTHYAGSGNSAVGAAPLTIGFSL